MQQLSGDAQDHGGGQRVLPGLVGGGVSGGHAPVVLCMQEGRQRRWRRDTCTRGEEKARMVIFKETTYRHNFMDFSLHLSDLARKN